MEPPRNNKKTLHRFYTNQTIRATNPPEKDVELDHDLICGYLELIIKVIEVTGHPKAAEFTHILTLMLTDIQKLKRIHLNANYGYFLSNYPYVRKFDQHENGGRGGDDDEDDQLNFVETINPEIIFCVNKCKLAPDEDKLIDYFAQFLEAKNEKSINDFKAHLNKAVIIKCNECSKAECGAMSQLMIKQHIRGFCPTPYKCENCDYQKTELELAKVQWQHDNCAETLRDN